MAPQLKTMRVIWAAMFIATFAYLFVATQVPHPAQPEQPILLPALAAVALLVAVMSVVFPAMQLKKGLQALNLPLAERQDMNAERMFRDLPPVTRGLADPTGALRKAWPLYHVSFILSVALSEAVALFGFVLLFLGFPWFPAILFFATSWVLIAYHFPTESRLMRAVESASGLVDR